MTNTEFYKDQLENLIHVMRSPLVTLSLAAKTLTATCENKSININLKEDERYVESLDLIRSSVAKLNKYINVVDRKLSKIDK